MKRIIGERSSGKTLSCFDLCRKEKAFLIFWDEKAVELYQRLAKASGYEDIISKIITIDTWNELRDSLELENRKCVVDDIEWLLYKILKEDLIGYSINILDYPKENYTYLKGKFSEEIRKQVGEVEFKYYNEVK